jgi:hypothetical protein
MRSFPLAAGLALALASSAHAQCIDDPYEPNDSCSAPLAIQPGVYTGLVAEDLDQFTLFVAAGRKVTVDLYFDPSHSVSLNAVQLLGTCNGNAVEHASAPGHARCVFHNTGPAADLLFWFFPSGAPSCARYDFTVAEEALGATAFCGSQDAYRHCPCSNDGTDLLRGCENSSSTGGGALAGSGTTFLSSDGLRLDASFLPSGVPALLVQGTAQQVAGTFLGDGGLCLAGSVVRFPVRSAPQGNVAWGSGVAGDPPISVTGLVAGAETRYYQVWYRDPGAFCTAATFNLTNGVYATWLP